MSLTSQSQIVLAADDDPEVLDVLASAVEEVGIGFVGVETGEACLRLLQSQQPALILLDLQMPGFGGFETARRIRSGHPGLASPIVFLTVWPQLAHRAIARAAGGEDFLLKPINAGRLVERVAHWCQALEPGRRAAAGAGQR